MHDHERSHDVSKPEQGEDKERRQEPGPQRTRPPLAAILLAGGASSRMGVAKAWLDWRGRPLLSHLAGIMADFGARVIVVGSPGQELPPLPEGSVRVDDPPGDRGGPLVGIGVGLEALGAAPRPGEIALLSACDSVFLSPVHLDFLVAALVDDPDAEAVLPIDPPDPASGKRFAHPLASALRAAAGLEAARALLAAGRRRPVALFDALRRTLRVDAERLPDPRVLQTCNTPEEYAAACSAPL